MAESAAAEERPRVHSADEEQAPKRRGRPRKQATVQVDPGAAATPAEPGGADQVAALGGVRTKGKLGNWAGYSAVSVIRAIAARGVSAKRIRAIVAASGIAAKPITVSLQTSAGRNGKGAVAPLTDAQYEELLALAPEPAEQPAAV